MVNIVKFKEITDFNLIGQLVDFARKSANMNKKININNNEYELVYLTASSSAFFKSRSISIYFKTGRKIIRISDHWAGVVSKTAKELFKKSKKMNCISISGKYWKLDTKNNNFYCFTGINSSKWGWSVKAGEAGLCKINKDCDHFLTGRALAKNEKAKADKRAAENAFWRGEAERPAWL